MQDGETENFDKWSTDELVGFLHKAQLGDYGEAFKRHKISGRLAPLLSDNDLIEMGVSLVGDRLRIKSLILSLGRQAKYNHRTKTWWEGTELLYFSEAEKNCMTCAGFCPDGKLSVSEPTF